MRVTNDKGFNLMVEYVTFNHQYMGSNPIGLKI